ncbi:MAG: glycosyltransferase [Candidatus Dadabacteria bacterium]|nr:glycosyltransferase [Candidatus Dadabacteria bacterium]NIS08474.1 glycosyltransferase [Candidatus Dadabacteria bacterium]NIY21962.1 glycosyltransferase [Candidatus Dadabacteria bacterium]
MAGYEVVKLADYEKLIGAEAVDRISAKAEKLKDFDVAHINSTYYGGGVAEILSSLTLLMNSVGIKTEWRVIQGSPDFFSVTKKVHNALQGEKLNLSRRKTDIYEKVIYENSLRNHLNHDLVVIHDPQPLGMINHYKKHCPWVWRCHLDLTNPNKRLWNYMVPYIEKYDAVILTLKEYEKKLKTPQVFFMPAIDPFNIKNKKLRNKEIDERLEHYGIPTDLPLVVQISRFDRWKDPEGVIEAFKIARKEVDCTLVLLGNVATDDPEGQQIYESVISSKEDRIIILSRQDTALVNALQSRAQVVIQKSLREGFGLTVTEAMWKGTPVIGGDVGGIRYQIKNGENGFLVSSVEQTADKVVQLLKDKRLRKQMGRKARESVKKNFLMTRLLEQYLDLFNSFEIQFEFKS